MIKIGKFNSSDVLTSFVLPGHPSVVESGSY